MIPLSPFLSYIMNIPFNDSDGEWHFRLPLLPRITIDGYIVWLWPCWHRFVESTDWEGSNWHYVWAARKKTTLATSPGNLP